MFESDQQHAEVQSPVPNSKLITFLYLLMRDHLPTGAVCRTIQEAQNADMEKEFIRYSDENLRAMAESYARRISE